MRLPKHHEKYQLIKDKVYQLSAGYAGELEVDRILPEIGLPKAHTIMKDIRLEVTPNFYIQIDTLIITQHGIFLIEIKNYSGMIQFDETIGKTIKTSNKGEIEKFECSVHQVDRAVHGLTQIITKLPVTTPIIPVLIMANSKTEITQYPQSVPVKYKKQLPRYIRQHLTRKETLTEEQRQMIETQIHTHIPTNKQIPLCERYAISPTDLISGIICPRCEQTMHKTQGRSWMCAGCQFISTSVIEQLRIDWFELINPTLTNRQLRQFLQINLKSATRILMKLNLQKVGTTRNTYYTTKKQES